MKYFNNFRTGVPTCYHTQWQQHHASTWCVMCVEIWHCVISTCRAASEQQPLGMKRIEGTSEANIWGRWHPGPAVKQSIFYSAFILLHFEYAPIYLDYWITMDLSSVNPITHDRGATIAQDNLRTRRTSELRTETVKRERERERGIHYTSLYITSPATYRTPGNA